MLVTDINIRRVNFGLAAVLPDPFRMLVDNIYYSRHVVPGNL